MHGGGAALGVDFDLAHQRAQAKRQPPGALRGGNQRVDAGEDRADLAALHAMTAVVAGHAALARLADEHRLADRDDRDPQRARRLLGQPLGAPHVGRRAVELAVGDLRQALARAADADGPFDVAVERRQLVVRQRPVGLEPVASSRKSSSEKRSVTAFQCVLRPPSTRMRSTPTRSAPSNAMWRPMSSG